MNFSFSSCPHFSLSTSHRFDFVRDDDLHLDSDEWEIPRTTSFGFEHSQPDQIVPPDSPLQEASFVQADVDNLKRKRDDETEGATDTPSDAAPPQKKARISRDREDLPIPILPFSESHPDPFGSPSLSSERVIIIIQDSKSETIKIPEFDILTPEMMRKQIEDAKLEAQQTHKFSNFTPGTMEEKLRLKKQKKGEKTVGRDRQPSDAEKLPQYRQIVDHVDTETMEEKLKKQQSLAAAQTLERMADERDAKELQLARQIFNQVGTAASECLTFSRKYLPLEELQPILASIDAGKMINANQMPQIFKSIVVEAVSAKINLERANRELYARVLQLEAEKQNVTTQLGYVWTNKK